MSVSYSLVVTVYDVQICSFIGSRIKCAQIERLPKQALGLCDYIKYLPYLPITPPEVVSSMLTASKMSNQYRYVFYYIAWGEKEAPRHAAPFPRPGTHKRQATLLGRRPLTHVPP